MMAFFIEKTLCLTSDTESIVIPIQFAGPAVTGQTLPLFFSPPLGWKLEEGVGAYYNEPKFKFQLLSGTG